MTAVAPDLVLSMTYLKTREATHAGSRWPAAACPARVRLPADHAVDIRPQAGWAPESLGLAERDAHADQQAWMAVLPGTLYDAVAQAARDWTLDFVRQRAPGSLGAPLATLPRVQETVRAVQRTLKLTGNHGLSRHNPLERHLRNVLCGPVHAPQDDALLVAAGQVLLAGGGTPARPLGRSTDAEAPAAGVSRV